MSLPRYHGSRLHSLVELIRARTSRADAGLFAMAAALDPWFEFQFELGAPTAANLTLSAGQPQLTVQLTVGAVHVLYLASGNALPASAARGRVP